MSIKVTNEAFAGIRAGLNGTYAWLTQDNLDAISGTSNATWRTMLFALSFMHTVVQERRKFGALGFNIPYEFSQADLSASIQFIQNHITVVDSKKRPVDWPTVNYMGCAEQYGGKITDGFDEVRHDFTYCSPMTASTSTCSTPTARRGWRRASWRTALIIKLPSGQDIEVYRQYIYGLPLVENPEIIDLHTNADLVYCTQLTSNVLETIWTSCPRTRAAAAASRARTSCSGL